MLIFDHTRFYTVCSPDDGHNDARNMLSEPIVNKHLYLCHLLVLSSPTLMMHGHTNLKLVTVGLKKSNRSLKKTFAPSPYCTLYDFTCHKIISTTRVEYFPKSVTAYYISTLCFAPASHAKRSADHLYYKLE